MSTEICTLQYAPDWWSPHTVNCHLKERKRLIKDNASGSRWREEIIVIRRLWRTLWKAVDKSKNIESVCAPASILVWMSWENSSTLHIAAETILILIKETVSFEVMYSVEKETPCSRNMHTVDKWGKSIVSWMQDDDHRLRSCAMQSEQKLIWQQIFIG